MVSHGENGFIFDSHNADELADYMAQFIANPGLIAEFGGRASEAVASYTPARAAQVLAGLARGNVRPFQDLAPASPLRQVVPIPELTRN